MSVSYTLDADDMRRFVRHHFLRSRQFRSTLLPQVIVQTLIVAFIVAVTVTAMRGRRVPRGLRQPSAARFLPRRRDVRRAAWGSSPTTGTSRALHDSQAMIPLPQSLLSPHSAQDVRGYPHQGGFRLH